MLNFDVSQYLHSHIVHDVYYANVCVVVLQGEVVQADSSIVPAAVSGLSTQDVGLDLLKKKKKSQHLPYPLSPSSHKNNGIPPITSLSFPMSF